MTFWGLFRWITAFVQKPHIYSRQDLTDAGLNLFSPAALFRGGLFNSKFLAAEVTDNFNLKTPSTARFTAEALQPCRS